MSDTSELKNSKFKFSDDTIVYIRDLLALSLITKTDVVQHLRSMVFTTEKRGELDYLVPTEEYKKQYAIVATQLMQIANSTSMESDDLDSHSITEN